MTTQCAWCKRFKIDGEWEDEGGMLVIDDHITHGVCPPCKAEVEATIKKHSRKQEGVAA